MANISIVKVKMLKNILILAGFWFLFLIPENLSATHIVGGNLTYRHISGNTYQVRLVLRRDCFLGSPEAEFDNPASIAVFTAGGELAKWLPGLTEGQLFIPFMSSDTLNEYIRSDCGFEGTQVCVHETIYQGNISLPSRPGGYIIAYQRCCRNASLNNIMDPLETGSTYWVTINDFALAVRNTSPVFKQWPDVYICANKPLSFDHSAIDRDGDSLVYKLCIPNSGATRINPKPQPSGFPPFGSIQFAPPYSLADMMGGVPLKINPKTGEITVTPNLVGQFLVGVCVEEYRNGVLLSTVRRDFQFNVRVCSQPPKARFTTSESNCSGLKIEFYNNSLSSTAYQWDFNYPSNDPIFKSTLKDPVFTYPQSGIYNVRLRATRGSDGCFDTIIQKVAVFENKINTEFTYALTNCDNDSKTLTLLLSDLSTIDEPGYNINSWNWTVKQHGNTTIYSGRSVEVLLDYTGNVEIELDVTSNNGCKSLLKKLVNIDDIVPKLDFKVEYIGCPEDGLSTIRLVNISGPLNPYATIKSTKWIVLNQEYPGDSVLIVLPRDIKDLNIEMFTTFYNLCDVNLSKNIQLKQRPSAAFSVSGDACEGLSISFTNQSLGTNRYEWNFNYPDNNPAYFSTSENPQFIFPVDGIYNILLKAVNDADGCFDTINRNVYVFENKLTPEFSLTVNSCTPLDNKIVLILKDSSTVGQSGFVVDSWKWQVTQGGVTKIYTGSQVEIPVSYTGNIEILLNITASNGCKSQITKEIDINDILPEQDFKFELTGCPSDGIAEIKLTNLSGPLNPYATISSSSWTIGSQTFSGDPLIINLPQDTKNFDVTLKTVFGELCAVDLKKTFDLSTVVPRVAYTYDPVTCPDAETIRIKLSYDPSKANGIPLSELSWIAGTATSSSSYTTNEISFDIPKDSTVLVALNATFANGCIDKFKDSFIPGPFATIKFNASPLVICPDEQKSILTNGNASWTYTWSPTTGLDLSDPKNPKVTGTVNQTYFVTVTDGLCTVDDKVDVVVLQGGVLLSIDADTSTCDGKVILSASGGIGQGVYTWGTDPAFNQIVGMGQVINTSFNGREQTYYVKYAGDACSTSPAIIKVKNQTPKIDNLSPYTICRKDTFQVLTLNQIPLHINNFTWEPDIHIVSGANLATPTIGIGANENNPFVLYYKVVNQFGCSLRDSVTISIKDNPVVNFDFKLTECGDYEICFNASGSYTGFIKWDFGDPTTENDVSLEKSPCYRYPVDGTYNIKLVNLVNVCPFKGVEKQVVVNPLFKIDRQNDIIVCKGDSIKLTATSNIQNVKYTWTNLTGQILSDFATYNTQIKDDSKFIIKGQDIYGCIDIDTIAVNVFKFQFDIKTADSLCINENSTVRLNIADPQNYIIQWGPSDCVVSGGNTTNPVIIAKDQKTITLALKHIPTGCLDSSSFKPLVTRPFSFDITAPSVLCIDVPTLVDLKITNPTDYLYQWTPSDQIISGANSTNPIIKVGNDKVFSVKVTNKISGCSQSKDILIKAGQEVFVDVDAKPDFTIFEGKSLDIFVSNPIKNAAYVWSNGGSGLTINVSPKETSTYTVTVTDENGCTATDEVVVTVRKAKCDEDDVFIPNAFTPNNDRNNDIFIVRSNFIDELELIIYNRWGQEVFHTKDKNVGWDGTFNGTELPPDAYAYYLKVVCINTFEYKKKGNVTLIR